MKKTVLSAVTLSLLLTSLSACNSNNNQTLNTNSNIVQAQSSITKTLSTNKQETTVVKKYETDKDSNLNKSIANKKNTDSVKKADKLVVKYDASPLKNSIGVANNSSIARFTLRSMDRTRTYSDGYKVGIEALKDMARNDVYVAKLGWAAGNATKEWDNGFKVIAAALQNIARETPNTPEAACDLIIKMMNSTDTYVDGYKSGYAALEVIGRTDNRSIRQIVSLSLRQADSTREWKDGYHVIGEALIEIKRMFRN